MNGEASELILETINSRAAVIDNGSYKCKCGFAGEETPRASFHSVVGRPISRQLEISSNPQRLQKAAQPKPLYVGEEAMEIFTSTATNCRAQRTLELSRPVEHGEVVNWEDAQRLWYHAFYNELRCTPEDQPLMMTVPALNSKNNREQITEVLFESFGVPALYLQTQAVLALYATGRTTGLLLDSGEGVTSAVPIFEGYALRHAVKQVDIAGSALTDYLTSTIHSSETLSMNQKEIARFIKERLCYVSLNPSAEEANRLANSAEEYQIYQLPDGNFLELGSTRWQCPELLFDPSIIGRDDPSITDTLFHSVLKTEVDIRKDMLSNIVLAGGSTMFPGLKQRIHAEIQQRVPRSLQKVKIEASPERKHAVWIGGSLLASLPSFENQWVTVEEYEEVGPEVIHQKCF